MSGTPVRPRVLAGAGALTAADGEWQHAIVVIDASLAQRPGARDRQDWLRASIADARVIPVHVDAMDTAAVERLNRQLDRQDSGDLSPVVAVGGGALIDAVKLAALRGPRGFRLGSAVAMGRSGLVALSDRVARPRPLLLAPTTTGTAAESSQVASVVTAKGKRLVHAHALAADIAVLDPALTRGLPVPHFRSGLVEALLRVLGPYGTAPPPAGAALTDEADRRAEELLSKIGTLLDAADEPGDLGGPRGDALRLAAARTSSDSQLAQANDGRDPFAWRLWFLANELSHDLRVPKMTATHTLLPIYWQRVLDGDDRFGDADRLLRGWRIVSDACEWMRLGPDPVAAVRHLVGRWGLATVPVTRAAALRIAERTAFTWGQGLPMLGQLTRDDILACLASA